MNSVPTVTIPLSTAEKLAQIARAMLALSEEMKHHARQETTATLSFSIPELVPPEHVPNDQTWFWGAEWQKGEQVTNEDMQTGKISKRFTSTDELFEELNRHV